MGGVSIRCDAVRCEAMRMGIAVLGGEGGGGARALRVLAQASAAGGGEGAMSCRHGWPAMEGRGGAVRLARRWVRAAGGRAGLSEWAWVRWVGGSGGKG